MNLCARCLADLPETQRVCPHCGLTQPEVPPPPRPPAEITPGATPVVLEPDPAATPNPGEASAELWISEEMPLQQSGFPWRRWTNSATDWTRRRWPILVAAIAVVTVAVVASDRPRPAWTATSELASHLDHPPSIAWQLSTTPEFELSRDGERLLTTVDETVSVVDVSTGAVLWRVDDGAQTC